MDGTLIEHASEYKSRCHEAKRRYREEIAAHGDSERAREWRSEELAAIDRQYREGEPMTGCGKVLR